MANPTQPDIDTVAFETTYADHLAKKSNYDAAGNLRGPLPTSQIASAFTAEYGDAVDDFLLTMLWRLAGQAKSANEHGLRAASSDAERTTALQAALDAAAVAGNAVIVPAGEWSFDGQLVNATAVPIVCFGELVFTGSGEDAIVIGDAAEAVQYNSGIRSTIRLRRSAIDYTDVSAGVVLHNVYEGRFAFAVEDFAYGLSMVGTDAGCVYNHIELQRMYGNLVAVRLRATGSGWCNENTFEGGRIGNLSTTSTASRVVGVQLEDDTSASGPNGNKFLGTSIELNNIGSGDTAAFVGVGAGPISFNVAEQIRFEGPDYLLDGTALIDNRFDLAFGMPNPGIAADLLGGDTAADQLQLQRNRFSSSRSIGSAEPRTLARFGANNIVEVGSDVTRPAVGVIWIESVTTITGACPGSRDGDAVTQTHDSYATGVILDLRNATRDFERVCWLKARLAATGGRFICVPWDASFTRLEGADDCGPLTWAGGGGLDYFRTGSDMTADTSEVMIAFGDDVEYAFVGFASGSADLQYRELEIQTLPTSDIEVLKDSTIYDSISSGTPGIGHLDTSDAIAASIPDVPAAGTDYPLGMICRSSAPGAGALGWAWNGTAWVAV